MLLSTFHPGETKWASRGLEVIEVVLNHALPDSEILALTFSSRPLVFKHLGLQPTVVNVFYLRTLLLLLLSCSVVADSL